VAVPSTRVLVKDLSTVSSPHYSCFFLSESAFSERYFSTFSLESSCGCPCSNKPRRLLTSGLSPLSAPYDRSGFSRKHIDRQRNIKSRYYMLSPRKRLTCTIMVQSASYDDSDDGFPAASIFNATDCIKLRGADGWPACAGAHRRG